MRKVLRGSGNQLHPSFQQLQGLTGLLQAGSADSGLLEGSITLVADFPQGLLQCSFCLQGCSPFLSKVQCHEGRTQGTRPHRQIFLGLWVLSLNG